MTLQIYPTSWFTNENLVMKGSDGVIYQTPDGQIVKFFRDSRRARKEERINREINRLGARTPRIEALIQMNFPQGHLLHNNGGRQWGLVMEKLDGTSPDANQLETKFAFAQQLDIVEQAGYRPVELGCNNNSLFLENEMTVTLFDFSKWKKGTITSQERENILNGGYLQR